ncbi:hypothetical protein PHK61_19970 [Actinomycetospora lutea]|uniref:helix-turn-helix domain-containing protein n=1 Tax=Actinomycetospora lutea TaxID=663604 RepID=UPI002365E687|nr:helix-turn-helix domain-containing protein [Actinomycetospora lutea]MDD7940705.1 hypothetical protein [Actinomycetospora lutea]
MANADRKAAALGRVDVAKRKRDEAKAAADKAESDLRAAIFAADRARVPHTEIADHAGMHRNTVRRIVEAALDEEDETRQG